MSQLNTQNWFEGRAEARSTFLQQAGWADAVMNPVGEDCAFRRYFRLEKNGRNVILMEAVPDDSDIATPGHRLADFVRIGAYLRGAGLNSPEVYDADIAQGYLLLEDFGDMSFKQAAAGTDEMETLYALATDVLTRLRQNKDIVLPHYYDSHVHKGLIRVIDWYLPAVRGEPNPAGLGGEFLAVWDEIEQKLPPCPQGVLHIDYHVENLMWLPRQDGLKRCGILDFQGAMQGPLPYDLANLLEDARQDIPADLRAAMLARFCAAMTAEEKEAFESWYRVLATQFHCRIAGQFIRLAIKDGKDRYLQYLPRVTAYLHEGLDHPVLEPLKRWFSAQGVAFDKAPDIRPEFLQGLVHNEAF